MVKFILEFKMSLDNNHEAHDMIHKHFPLCATWDLLTFSVQWIEFPDEKGH